MLADRIDWKYFEDEFSELYSKVGQASMPLRLMIGCLLLKNLYNYGDESLAKAWIMNPYMQYFCGYACFEHRFPFDPSDFVHFRKRLGEAGIEKIFAYSVQVHGSQALSEQVLSNTTVQENNTTGWRTTSPTESKLAKKIIDACNAFALQEGLPQRQSYVRTSKQLLRDTHNGKTPQTQKKGEAGPKKTTGHCREVTSGIRAKHFRKSPGELPRVIGDVSKSSEPTTKRQNKIYSLHKPFTDCIAKGKAHNALRIRQQSGPGGQSRIVSDIGCRWLCRKSLRWRYD